MQTLQNFLSLISKNKSYEFIFIFSIGFVLYFNTIQNGYNLDDELVTINHRNTSRGLSAVTDIFSQYYYEDKMGYKYEYRPITHLSFALEHELFGESPQTSHFINVILYSLLCFLIYVVLNLLFPKKHLTLVWLTTLIFIFHPIHTEVVASIKNRDELLAILFLFFSIYLALKFKESHLVSVTSPLLVIISLFSKSSVLPSIFIFYLFANFIDNQKIVRFIIIISVTFLFAYFSNLFSLTFIDLLKLLFATYFAIFLGFISQKINLISKIKSFRYSPSLVKEKLYKTWIKLHRFIKILSIIGILSGISTIFFAFLYYYNILNNFKSFFYISLSIFLISSFLHQNKYALSAIVLISAFSISLSGIFKQSDVIYTYLFFTLTELIILLRHNKNESMILFIFSIFIHYLYYDSPFLDQFILLLYLTISFPIIFFENTRAKNYLIGFLVFSKLLIAISILYSNFYLNTALASTIIVSSLIYFTYSKFNLDHWPIFIKLTVLSLFVIVVFSIPNQNGNDIIKNPFQKITLSPYNAPQPTFDRPLTFIETPVNFDSPMEVKVATGMSVFKEYLQKTIVPYPMGFYYGYAYITPRSFKEVMPWVMMGVFLFLSLLSLYWIIKKHYILAFGLILYLAGIFQALGIFVPIPGALGDRFLFQPSIGFSILLAYPFYKAIGTKWQKHASFIFIGILIIYGYLTIQRNAQWKDHLTLFRDDIKYLDKSVQAHNLLAIHLNKYSFNEVDQNKRIAMQEEAASHFKRAIEIYPKFSNLHFDLGRTNLLLNKLDEALLAFKEAAKLDTTYSESFNNVAAIYQQKGMNKEAIEYYKRSLEIYKFNPLIYTNLSFIYFQTGDFESSLNISREALTHIPNNIEPYENIGKTFYGMGLKDSSIVYFEKAHQLFPNHPNTIDALARLYTEKKDPRANYFMQLLNQMQSQNR